MGPSQNELDVLRFCQEPQSMNKLMRLMGWKNRTKFRNRFLRDLLEQGFLEMTIPNKPNSSLQKYALTQAGKKRIGVGS